MRQSLPDLLAEGAGGEAALIVPGLARLTYDELREQVAATAGRLASLGVERGDRVAYLHPNGAEAVILFLAAATAATAAPLNPAYKTEELRFYLEDTGARLLLVPPGGAEGARAACPEGVAVIEAAFRDGEMRLAGSRAAPAPSPAPNDVALVLHTSGTTSRPKQVPIRHRNLAASAGNLIRHYGLMAEDVSLCVMPLFHVHGIVMSTLAALGSGGAEVVMPGGFNAMGFWALVREHRVTWFSAVPTIHQMLLRRSGSGRPEGARGLRFIRSSSSALSAATMQQLEETIGVPVIEAYSMTEAAHQMTANPLPPGERRPGSVGRGAGVEVGIVDDAWRQQPAGTTGEVVVRGPSVVDGYANNQEANAASFREGWFRTGDQGVLSEDGYLTLVGRLKELINRGGEKIAPREIDDVLLQHPAVAEAVAFGLPHPTWGEEVAVAVVLREPVAERELLRYCRERLADFKVPKRVFIVDEIPRTATGKVQRRGVAAALAPSA